MEKNPLEKITVLNRYSPNTGVLNFKRANSITYEDSGLIQHNDSDFNTHTHH